MMEFHICCQGYLSKLNKTKLMIILSHGALDYHQNLVWPCNPLFKPGVFASLEDQVTGAGRSPAVMTENVRFIRAD